MLFDDFFVEGIGYRKAQPLLAGKIHLAPLITHRFPLEAFADAYRTLREGTGPRGKVLLEVNPL